MPDLPPGLGTKPRAGDDDAGTDTYRGATAGAPRWVKVFGAIALVLVVLVAVLWLSGFGGGHGPGRHSASDDAGGDAPAFFAVGGHSSPEDGRP